MFARGLKAGHTRTRARRERGAVAVEFAFILPILAMLLLGVMTAGLAFGQAIGIANAVREGVRFAATAIPATGTPPFTNAQWTSWAGDVNTRTRAMLVDAGSGEATVCTQLWMNTASTAATPTEVLSAPVCNVGSQAIAGGSSPTPPVIDAKSCAVTVWAIRRVRVNAVLINVNPPVRRESIARYERAC